MSDRVDVVVVGSGPGGSVTARECARAGLRVLVLEEGDRVEPGAVAPFTLDQMRRQYRAEGLTAALGRPSIAYTEARCAGGGSEVNSGLYHRTPGDVLRRWSTAFGVEGLDEAALEPHQRTVEFELGIDEHRPADLPAGSAVLARGAAALGWSGQEVPRWVHRGAAPGDMPERRSMLTTYLPQAETAGAELRTGLRVRRVLLRGDRASGVEVEDRDGRTTVVQADTVVVAAGAIQTPALLQRSGLRGPVGRNLRVHPTVKVVAHFDDEVNDPADVPGYQVKEFAPLISFGGSASAPPLLSLQLLENWPAFGRHLDDWRRLGSYYAAITPVGRGRVDAVPTRREPLVTYRLDRRDLALLRSGLGRLLHLMLAAGARAVYPSYAGAVPVTSPDQVRAAVAGLDAASASLMTVHLVGTARMGSDPRRSATDSSGRVHGVGGLWVNDASLLPDAPGVNPQGTIMAIAHRNVAELLR